MKVFHILKSQKGTSLVFFAIMLTVIAGFAAISVDIGLISYEKAKLSNTVDAAALAGAQELLVNFSNTENIVNTYIDKNNSGLSEISIIADNLTRSVEVSATKPVNSYFAKVFGVLSQDVFASAKASVENISAMGGARPFAVVQQTFVYGNLYTLKEGASDGYSGNYNAIALGGSGTNIYENNLLYGYDGIISVGDIIPTEPGVVARRTERAINTLVDNCNHLPACTHTEYKVNCSRIIFIPVVNTLEVNGRAYVLVLGFATFFLEGADFMGGHTEIHGRFITYQAQGETSPDVNDYGTYGIKLIK
ncbi:UNVERIFIED_CONTAM: putative Flp pilus-assembly TadE/G-like protein [Acetivibrio alkalicellulosi]